MTNYSLEEFKRWLEEDESRKENLPNWNAFFVLATSNEILEKVIDRTGVPRVLNFVADEKTGWNPYRQAVLKWKTEVDDKREHSLFFQNLKKDIEKLKAQLADYESLEVASNINEPLNTKLPRKRQELQTALTSNKKSTTLLRKEIKLLEKIQTLENQVKDLETKETSYQAQIQQKEQQITQQQEELVNLQTQLNNQQEQITNLTQQKQDLTNQLQQKTLAEQQFKTKSESLQTQLTTKTNELNRTQTKINSLQQKINNFISEKRALEEKTLQERQQALNTFNQEKLNLRKDLRRLIQEKDTFQKSADYLRETLKEIEKELENTKTCLASAQTNAQQEKEDQTKLLTAKEEELRQRNEALKTIQAHNTSLQTKLSAAHREITQLSEWISQLESASAEGDAFEQLKKELALAHHKAQELQEQLTAKQPKSYWWVYALLALLGIYLVVK